MKEENISTYASITEKPLTIESLKEAALSIQKMEERPLPKGLSWFTRLMAKFGWHRKYEVIVFDKDQFSMSFPFPKIKV